MDLNQYDGKSLRVTCIDGQIYEGVAELYYDEDETMQYYLWLRCPDKNAIIQLGASDIKSVSVLNP